VALRHRRRERAERKAQRRHRAGVEFDGRNRARRDRGLGRRRPTGFLQGFGMPVSLFAEYQHTWWQEANFITPAASQLFNYNFRRQDDVLRFGFMLALESPTPAASTPAYPVKALPSK
jgi:hypothetical protein